MDGSWGQHATWSKSAGEGQILNDLPRVWNVKQNNTELTDGEKRLVVARGRAGGGGGRESAEEEMAECGTSFQFWDEVLGT